jgi:histidinol-phosphate phosphatase family protein
MKGTLAPPGTAVFVDRDGTLNHDNGYVTSPEQLVVFPGVAKAIARLNHYGVKVILVTNQSAVGRGLMTSQVLSDIHERLAALIKPYGAALDAIFTCPHHPQEGCGCRKPKAGLIYQAVDRFSLDLASCFLVGDKRSDMEAAHKVGIPGVLVMTSPYSEQTLQARDEGQVPIAHVAETFVQAVEWIEERIVKRGSHSITATSESP